MQVYVKIVDKYLVQDRSGGGVYETPQFMYMMIALTIFAEYPKETRMSYVRRYYDAISKAQNQHSHTNHGRC
jgi:ribonucleoside-diphosphate reductase alpha chain